MLLELYEFNKSVYFEETLICTNKYLNTHSLLTSNVIFDNTID